MSLLKTLVIKTGVLVGILALLIFPTFAEDSVIFEESNQLENFRWSGYQSSAAINGLPCVTPCRMLPENYSMCETADGWTKLCSGAHLTDYLGNKCTGPCQAFSEYDSYWCTIESINQEWNSGNWSYCGPTISKSNVMVRQHKTSGGDYCVSECIKIGSSHNYTCKTTKGIRDYCSPIPGYDSQGRKCSSGCEKNLDATNYQCQLDNQTDEVEWSYCGPTLVSTETQYTHHGSKCVTPCNFESGKAENRCYDATGKKRLCSRIDGTSYLNERCTDQCDFKLDDVQLTTCTSNRGQSPCGQVVKAIESEDEQTIFPISKIPESALLKGSVENVLKIIDDESKKQVVFLEKISARKVLEMGQQMQISIVKVLSSWADNEYPVIDQPLDQWRILGNAENQNFNVSLEHKCYRHKQCKYTHFKLFLNKKQDNTEIDKAVIAEVRVSFSVLKEMPHEVVTALLRSAYDRHAIFFGGFRYKLENGEKVVVNDSEEIAN